MIQKIRSTMIILALVVLPLASLQFASQEASAADGVWTTKASMPCYTLHGFSMVVVGGMIYAIDGWNGYGNPIVEMYNPSTNTWTTKASMLSFRYWLATGAVGDKIYAIGGNTDDGITKWFVETVEMYDTVRDTWTTRANMSYFRSGLAVGVVGDKIYAIGGRNGLQYVSTVEMYDPATDTWTTKTSMPTARERLAIGVVDDKIYAIGGSSGSKVFSTVEMYDPATDTWTTKTSMPTARDCLAVGIIDGKLYAVDGADRGVEMYDPVTDTWTTKTSMLTARDCLAVGVIDGKLYAVGGNYTLNSPMEMYDPVSAPAPSPPQNLQAISGNGQVSLFWSAPTSDGGSVITDYKIYRGTTSGGETFLKSVGNSLTYLDASVTNGKKYYYQVSAVNDAGEGLNSSEAIATPLEFNPSVNGFSFSNTYPPFEWNQCEKMSLLQVEQKLISDPIWQGVFLSHPELKSWLVLWAYLNLYNVHVGGHCYGMSSMVQYYYEHPSAIPSRKTVFQLGLNDMAQSGVTVYKEIDYYQQSLLLDIYSFSKAKLLDWGWLSNSDELVKVKSHLPGATIVGLWSPEGEHAVVAYDFNDNTRTLSIYDPNKPDQNPNIVIQSDYAFSYPFTYKDENGIIRTSQYTRLCSLGYTDETVLQTLLDCLTKNVLLIKADCPVQLSVSFENGTCAGASASDGESHIVVVPNPSNNKYSVQLDSTGKGLYNLTIERIYNNKITYQNSSGSIEPGTIVKYPLSVSDGSISLGLPPINSNQNYLLIIIGTAVCAIFAIIVILLYMRRKKKIDMPPAKTQDHESNNQTHKQQSETPSDHELSPNNPPSQPQPPQTDPPPPQP